ncbi:protein SENESCENCE-ASSOCIATED GENE 21, mitochondrial-like isoform X2 [Lycium ferocissimum]|uniref:protein SENESCENCE-ASSOCIATED GENE 21, mitochondrial-like isoform X2 n=1 Tax=Lycium ferocissimum TaxID=112874 RepID=UPI002815BE23|nr:protein SENESCENCE-ASSOCIATED GENE 21, mitochondrial-like isoform X2 [Lycium ferocissimum]
MARYFSNSKIVSAFIVDSASTAISRRGYAAVSQGAVFGSVRGTGAVRSNVMMKKSVEESNKTTSWVPDPVTGYYRPESHVKEVDAAELRNMLLKHKRQH